MSTVYVGNLSEEDNEDSLTSFFQAFGKLMRVELIRDRASGRSRGFAFVSFEHEADAQKACTQANGKALHGNTLRVAPTQMKSTSSLHTNA